MKVGTSAPAYGAELSTGIGLGSEAGGDLGGTLPGPIVTGIQGIPISATPPTNGQELVYNLSTLQWEPTSEASARTFTFFGG